MTENNSALEARKYFISFKNNFNVTEKNKDKYPIR